MQRRFDARGRLTCSHPNAPAAVDDYADFGHPSTMRTTLTPPTRASHDLPVRRQPPHLRAEMDDGAIRRHDDTDLRLKSR
ncbi:hypothetical protein [Methylobacterium soli]|uniref:Uncharacterized protein n=1 Tax=Methylobacterium soli TaxID=553447 RepID=A0A6L3SZ43_9HYPH|nr:hypothetical protein [Methylobacterium soli]KAB1077913.1 hypothetical protein F6X53_17070 [Methylobacterium soli]